MRLCGAKWCITHKDGELSFVDPLALGLVYLSYPPLLAAIFVSDKAESTQCSHPT